MNNGFFPLLFSLLLLSVVFGRKTLQKLAEAQLAEDAVDTDLAWMNFCGRKCRRVVVQFPGSGEPHVLEWDNTWNAYRFANHPHHLVGLVPNRWVDISAKPSVRDERLLGVDDDLGLDIQGSWDRFCKHKFPEIMVEMPDGRSISASWDEKAGLYREDASKTILLHAPEDWCVLVRKAEDPQVLEARVKAEDTTLLLGSMAG
jgi:hypothetical protein